MEEENIINQLEMEPEKWLPISGYEGLYQVSSWGRVKSCARTYATVDGKYFKSLPNKIISRQWPYKGQKYLEVKLCKNGEQQRFSIHVLVALHFVPNLNPEKYDEVNHNDGDKLFNYYKNLEWTDGSGNMKHAYETGLQVSLKGEDHHMAKLTEEDVKTIRLLYKHNPIYNKYAKMYNVSPGTIHNLINKRTWKHVV